MFGRFNASDGIKFIQELCKEAGFKRAVTPCLTRHEGQSVTVD